MAPPGDGQTPGSKDNPLMLAPKQPPAAVLNLSSSTRIFNTRESRERQQILVYHRVPTRGVAQSLGHARSCPSAGMGQRHEDLYPSSGHWCPAHDSATSPPPVKDPSPNPPPGMHVDIARGNTQTTVLSRRVTRSVLAR